MTILVPLALLALIVAVASRLMADTTRAYIWKNLGICLFIVAVALTMRLPLGGRHFLGLEYEDAFVYAAASRQVLLTGPNSTEPMKTTLCIFGSMRDCQAESTYGGHLMTLPIISANVQKVLGYSPYTISFMNAAASIAVALLVYFLILSLGGAGSWAVCGALVAALTPAMSIFHTSALAETSSSLFVMIYVVACIGACRPQPRSLGLATATGTILVLSFLLAILIKRENLALLIVAPIAVFVFREMETNQRRLLILWCALSLIVSMLVIRALHLPTVELDESFGIGAPTFSFRNAFQILPVFIRAFSDYKLFSGSSLLFVLGFLALIRPQRIPRGFLVVYALFTLYLGAYTFHYRSYYQVVHGSVTPFESLRYISNFFPFFAIIAGLGGGMVIDSFIARYHSTTLNRYLLKGIVALVIVGSVPLTYSLKSNWLDDEFRVRIQPVIAVEAYLQNHPGVVLTDIPIAFQVFGQDTTVVVDSDSIGRNLPIEWVKDRLRNTQSILWLHRKTSGSPVDRQRYPEFYKFIGTAHLTDTGVSTDYFSLTKVTFD